MSEGRANALLQGAVSASKLNVEGGARAGPTLLAALFVLIHKMKTPDLHFTEIVFLYDFA